MIQLKILKGPQKTGEEINLSTGSTKIMGRGSQCDVQLLSYGISKQHCKITALPGAKLEIEDLGSSNGTFVNGVQIQKHILRPGDSISLSDFLFQIQWKPDVVTSNHTFSQQLSQGQSNEFSSPNSNEVPLRLNTKKQSSIQDLFASWIDPVGENFPIHKVILFGFLAWTFVTVVLSIFPFSKTANVKIQENSVQTARLYARQLARLNQKAIIDQRYSDIIGSLDERPGLTRGVLKTYILDNSRKRILSPNEEAGNSLPGPYAIIASQQSEEWWEYDPVDNVTYVSAPIIVGTLEGNVAAATALVVFNPSIDIFSFANILESALTSLIILLAFSLVAIFLYQRFILSPVRQMSIALEKSTMAGIAFDKPKVQWDELKDLGEKIATLLTRLPQNNQSNNAPEDWAVRVASEIGLPSAAFDLQLKILEWSDSMGQISGVRREYAVGAEIGVASRDMAFEANVRDLASRAQASPWAPQNSVLEFQGYRYVMSMIFGSDNYLLLLRKESE